MAEKRGRVWVVKNGVKHPTPFWDGAFEVLDQHDRGLLGLAVDPNFATNRYVYFLYTVDPDSNQIDDSAPGFGRLTRYQMSATDSNAVDPASRTVLMGATWREGPVSASESHTVGSVHFGADGSLLVSCGDGANFGFTPDIGGEHPFAFLPGRADSSEDIGALRSQYLGSLCGKILRIDPMTGHGYPTNPFWDGNPMSVRSRVWQYGLRNPFRFTVEPGTGNSDPAFGDPGILHIGDVGWRQWEELDIAAEGGKNFGWPCREGPRRLDEYWPPNPQPSHCGCDSLGLTYHNLADTTGPVSTWHHDFQSLSIPTGITGITAVGGTFYKGRRYPAQYRDRLFMADYGYNWIKVLETDSLHHLTGVLPFMSGIDGPVDIVREPGSAGDLLYVAIVDSEIRRIRYTGPVDNLPPNVFASVNPTFGVSPLTVNFSSAGTNDPEGDSLSYVWLFGDGEGSTEPNPVHVYQNPGLYLALVTVTDTFGGLNRAVVFVPVSNPAPFPSTGILDAFNRPDQSLGPPWTDDLAALRVAGNRLTVTSGGGGGGGNASALWDATIFASRQEVFTRLVTLPPAPGKFELMVQGLGSESADGYVGVRYDVGPQKLEIRTIAPSGTVTVHRVFAPIVFAPGDRIGVRTSGDGIVAVYRNAELVAATTLIDWPYSQLTGRIGVRFENASGAVLDDFGGGSVPLVPNFPPSATILAPPDSSFFVAADTVHLSGTGTDPNTPSDSLSYLWEADLHHNVHVHPNVFHLTGRDTSFVGKNHDDGTGVYLHVRFIVSDPAGLADTTAIDLFPEADLKPSIAIVVPETLHVGDPLGAVFRIANPGRMLARRSHWRLTFGDSLLAEGDVIVPPRDSVSFFRGFPSTPLIAPGPRELRLVVDANGEVVETDETNNHAVDSLFVRPVLDPVPPIVVLLAPGGGDGWPIGSMQSVRWSATDNIGVTAIAIELSRDAGASFAVLDSGLAHSGHHEFLVEGPPCDSAVVRITARDAQGNLASDTSDGMFQIMFDEKSPSVFLVTPNGGEAWHKGSVHPLQWIAQDNVGVTRVDLAVSYDNGGSFVPIATGLPNTGAYGWYVEGALTSLARIQVVTYDAVGNAAADQSDGPFTILEGIVGTEPVPFVPTVLALSNPYPSPSRGRVSLVLDLPAPANVSLDVYDLRGRRVWSGPSGMREAGRWTLDWPGRTEAGARMAPGVYLALVTADGRAMSRRIVVLD